MKLVDPSGNVAEVLRLGLVEGVSVRQIARQLHLARKTVRKILGRHRAPLKPTAAARGSLLDPYEKAIHTLLDDTPEMLAPAVLERLRPLGYTGGVTILRDRLRHLRKHGQREAFLTLHFEAEAAMQIDWADFGFALPGVARRVSAFVAVPAGARVISRASCARRPVHDIGAPFGQRAEEPSYRSVNRLRGLQVSALGGDLRRRQVVQEANLRGGQFVQLSGRLCLIEALLYKGAIEAAGAEALALGEVAADPHMGMWYLAILARIRLVEGRALEARESTERALSQFRSCGIGLSFRHAMLLLVHAEVLRALGDCEAACQAIREAAAELERRAAKIPDPEVRRSFLENFPDHRRTLDLARQWSSTHAS